MPPSSILAEAKLNLDQLHSIKLIDGSTPVPAVKQIQDTFSGNSFTLDQDKAVARGATFACAMLSPVFMLVNPISPITSTTAWVYPGPNPLRSL